MIAGWLASVAVLGCGESVVVEKETRSRSEAVTATGTAGGGGPSPAPAPASASTAGVRRPLCERAPRGTGEGLDAIKLGRIAHPGEPAVTAPPEGFRLTVGGGKWTWINLWAGWCRPCLEEMPRLLAWEKKLAAVRLVFVSVDDDLRMSQRFLDAQPSGGVRWSWHLGDDDQKKLAEALGLPDISKLPTHAFVDPRGKLRCLVTGEIYESDYAALEAFLKKG